MDSKQVKNAATSILIVMAIMMLFVFISCLINGLQVYDIYGNFGSDGIKEYTQKLYAFIFAISGSALLFLGLIISSIFTAGKTKKVFNSLSIIFASLLGLMALVFCILLMVESPIFSPESINQQFVSATSKEFQGFLGGMLGMCVLVVVAMVLLMKTHKDSQSVEPAQPKTTAVDEATSTTIEVEEPVVAQSAAVSAKSNAKTIFKICLALCMALMIAFLALFIVFLSKSSDKIWYSNVQITSPTYGNIKITFDLVNKTHNDISRLEIHYSIGEKKYTRTHYSPSDTIEYTISADSPVSVDNIVCYINGKYVTIYEQDKIVLHFTPEVTTFLILGCVFAAGVVVFAILAYIKPRNKSQKTAQNDGQLNDE